MRHLNSRLALNVRKCCCAAAVIVGFAVPSIAANSSWNEERFAGCTRVLGLDDLDPQRIWTTDRCPVPDRVDEEPVGMSKLTVLRYAVVTWDKLRKDPPSVGIGFEISYDRHSTILGGDASAGASGYYRITMLLPEGLAEADLERRSAEVEGCQNLGRGWMNVSTCKYREKVHVWLTREMFIQFYTASMQGNQPIKMKIFSARGENILFDMYPAEVVAAGRVSGVVREN